MSDSIEIIVLPPREIISIINSGPMGLPGPSIVNVGTFENPTVISGILTTQVIQRARMFVRGISALSEITAITDGSGTQELYIYSVDDNFKVLLDSLSNVQVSGIWEGGINSVICLHWISGPNQWVEDHRNEI